MTKSPRITRPSHGSLQDGSWRTMRTPHAGQKATPGGLLDRQF